MSEKEANTTRCFINGFMEGVAAIMIYNVCFCVCVYNYTVYICVCVCVCMKIATKMRKTYTHSENIYIFGTFPLFSSSFFHS